MTRMNSAEVRQYVIANGGGTFEILPEGPHTDRRFYVREDSSGYIVGIRGNHNVVTTDLELLDLDVYAHYMGDFQEIGFWLSPQDNLWYIDPIKHLYNFDSALALAVTEKQQAIWDCGTKQEVWVG